MQIGEIMGGTCGAVHGGQVGFQLDQIARHEPGGKTQMAQGVDQQPRGIAARSLGDTQRFLGGLHAGFKADDIADFSR